MSAPVSAALCLLLVGSCAPSDEQKAPHRDGSSARLTQFAEHWYDGKAEVSSYRLVRPRYGAPREGTAVMIWVTEPFSKEKHVKLDDTADAGYDEVTVLKLNLTRSFLTGIYPYSLMTSVFTPVQPRTPQGANPLKVTFSAQEWCGHAFHQLDRRGASVRALWRSYFETSADGDSSHGLGERTLLGDGLWHRVRELSVPLEPGSYRFLPALSTLRLAHREMARGSLEIARSAEPEEVTVPLGTFETTRWQLDFQHDSGETTSRTVWVERAYPRRIVAWEQQVLAADGLEPGVERAELMGSMRSAYWEQNGPGDEVLREQLGLSSDR